MVKFFSNPPRLQLMLFVVVYVVVVLLLLLLALFVSLSWVDCLYRTTINNHEKLSFRVIFCLFSLRTPCSVTLTYAFVFIYIYYMKCRCVDNFVEETTNFGHCTARHNKYFGRETTIQRKKQGIIARGKKNTYIKSQSSSTSLHS
jgi:hypothetical protein